MSRRQKNKKTKNKKSNIILNIILVIALCIFVFSAYQLIRSFMPYYSGGKEYDKVKKQAITTVKDDGTDGENKEEIQINFDELLSINPDTVAWIRFEEPSIINYPVVKSKDNNEYLTKTFSANDNKLGAIFMDMDAASDFSGRNTIIYGHNLNYGGEMFSQLNKYADEAFYREHPYFYIYTPDGKIRTYQVFSAAVIKDTADNYKNFYESDEDYLNYLQMCVNTSNYNVGIALNEQSQIVSLSTCTNVNDDERFFLQGVLIEIK